MYNRQRFQYPMLRGLAVERLAVGMVSPLLLTADIKNYLFDMNN